VESGRAGCLRTVLQCRASCDLRQRESGSALFQYNAPTNQRQGVYINEITSRVRLGILIFLPDGACPALRISREDYAGDGGSEEKNCRVEQSREQKGAGNSVALHKKRWLARAWGTMQ